MSREQDLSSKCAVSQDTKNGSVASDAQAAVGFVQVQNTVYQKLNNDSPVSVMNQVQDSAYSSICDSAEDLQDPEHRSGTEHPDLPRVPHPAEHNWRDLIYESEMRPRKDEDVEIPMDALSAQNGSATRGTGLPQLPDPAGHRQGEAASLLGQSESQLSDGIGEKCLDGSATRSKQKRTLGRHLAPVEWIRSHPVLTLAVLTLLLLLAVALAVSLAAVSGRSQTDAPVTPVTPLLLACPDGLVGYNRICYFLSRDHLTWDQAKAWCSELGASLAVLKDWEMEFLFRFSRNVDYWIGLHIQDQRLQWVDGSNFNSSVPLLGNAGCVFLADNVLRAGVCSNDMLYICSRPQTRL